MIIITLKITSPFPPLLDRPTSLRIGNFPKRLFFDSTIDTITYRNSNRKSSAIMQPVFSRMKNFALRSAPELEFRVPVRLRKTPKSGKFPFEPASLFCYFLGQCQKVSRKRKVSIKLHLPQDGQSNVPKGDVLFV